MIKAIGVTNHLGESLTLELGFPERSGFLIQEIEGLGPVKADINVVEMSTTDGALFTSSRINTRNIVIHLLFMGSPTIEDTRQLSYKYFPVKKRVRLLVETDNRMCEIYGNVESNEPDIFSSQSGTVISIMCPDPYFYSVSDATTIFSGIEAMFDYEFSNESLTENLIEFSNIKSDTLEQIIYDGDSDVGMKINIHALGEATNITIYNTETREVMKINTTRLAALTGYGIITGDDIIVSTVKGNKYVLLLRGGAYINILNCLDKNTSWFQLSKGVNTFAYTAETGLTNLEFRIENRTVYEGV